MRIRKINKTHAEVLMYGPVGGWFVDGLNFASLLNDLETDGVTEVTFRMHTYGGSVFEGNVVGNAFATTKMKINIIVDGVAASMGCMILPYVPVENIQVAENGFGMIHRPTSQSSGDASDLMSDVKLLLDIEGNFIKTLAQRTGKPADEIKNKFFDGKDHWLNADEMIEYKLAGSKVKSVASIAQLDKIQIENMGEEAIYNQFVASAKEHFLPKNSDTMKKELIAAFGLVGLTEESSDTAVISALQAKFKENSDRLTALETEAKTKKTAAIKAALDTAQTAGKITAETRPTYEGIGEASGVEVLNTVLAGLGTKSPITKVITGGKTSTGSVTDEHDWNWYQKNDAKALEAMVKDNPDQFKALYKKEYGTDPVID